MDFTRLKQLFTEEDAVSPVIGVILMVAITVILAAVIGTFVLGLGENVQDSAPQANFQFEYSDTADADAANDQMTITHTGGEDVDATTLTVQIGSLEAWTEAGYGGTGLGDGGGSTWSGAVSTGDSLDIDEDGTNDDYGSGDAVRVIWTSPSGSNSNTIGQSTVPS